MSSRSTRPRGLNIFSPFRKRRQRIGWTGWWYRQLDRVAPVTRSSPLRRIVQAVCLVMFLVAFFYICWPYAATFDTTTFSDKAVYRVDAFLLLDPLVGVSTALAGRCFNTPTILWTVGILLFCLLVPRAFCGYLCPLGTAIDLFDWLVGRWFRLFHLP